MNLDRLNLVDTAEAKAELLKCCSSKKWVDQILGYRPFETPAEVLSVSENVWFKLDHADWLEAFNAHPRIGDISSLRRSFASTESLAENEQSGVNRASEGTLKALAQGNQDYENKFGFIFIVCATGKSAEEMLHLLTQRISNEPEEELTIAAKEQNKITK